MRRNSHLKVGAALDSFYNTDTFSNRMALYFVCLILASEYLVPVHLIRPYEPWTPASINRTDLRCEVGLCSQSYPHDVEGCCVCTAKPYWQLSGEINSLRVEYIRRGGSASVIGENSVVSQLIHSYGFLSELPQNICDFTNIVELEFQHNYIISIGDISCLRELDTLDVSHNKILHISNDTFIGMTKLRILMVTHNGLTSLDPFTITGKSLHIFFADFSFNNQTELDLSNIIPENNFCKYDFSENDIKDFVNDGNFELDPEKIYEGGYVELIGNNFTEFINFEDLGIENIMILGKVLNFGFSMPDVKWDCDCKIEPFLELAEGIIKKIWRDYFDIKCWNPPEHRGKSITDIVKNDQLDILICNLTEADKCPRDCRCFHQPSRDRTVINCSSLGLDEMPKYLPEKNDITLILSNNSIQDFLDVNYLQNISILNFNKNILNNVSDKAIERLDLNVEIDFRENDFRKLQRVFQKLHPCKAKMGTITIHCDCDSLWITHWLKNKHGDRCFNITEIICSIDGALISAFELTREDVCETSNYIFNILSSILGILFSIIVGVAGICYIFRYELYLIRRKIMPLRSNKVVDCMKYDVYISLNDDDKIIRRWVVQILAGQLQLGGYRIFIPCRDLLPGMAREEAISEKINRSKNFITILCESYLSEEKLWTEIEWRYIWHSFRQNTSKNIIVINFGQLDTAMIYDPKLKAFLRLGLDLDFANRKHHLLKDVKYRLGSPILGRNYHDQNAKTRFEGRKLLSKNALEKESYAIKLAEQFSSNKFHNTFEIL